MDDSCSDEKIKGESGTTDLVLGSRLDKGDRKSTSNPNKNDNDKDDGDGVDEDKKKDDLDDASVDGVMSLCSDDFKFSNSTSL